MTASHDLSIWRRSAVPGRVRWDVAALAAHPNLAPVIDRTFALRPGVISVSASAVTGRVLLTYEHGYSLDAMEAMLKEALERAFAAGDADSVAPPPPAAAAALDYAQGNPLLRIMTHGERSRRAAKLAIATAFAARLFEAGPPALIGWGLDIITRPQTSLFASLGFATVRSQLMALGALGVAVWTLDSLMGYLHRRA